MWQKQANTCQNIATNLIQQFLNPPTLDKIANPGCEKRDNIATAAIPIGVTRIKIVFVNERCIKPTDLITTMLQM